MPQIQNRPQQAATYVDKNDFILNTDSTDDGQRRQSQWFHLADILSSCEHSGETSLI